MVRFICLLLALFGSIAVAAQNDFRSRQSGDWNQSSTWEEFIAGSWQLTGNTPDFNSGNTTILSPHTVTVTASVTIDQTTIQLGGTLVVNDAVVVTLNNGSGTDFSCAGTVDLLAESFLDGAGSLSLTGTLEAGSLNATGALVAGTTVGNLRNSGTRSYSTGSTVTYNGTSAQIIGSGHPGNSSPSGIFTEIDNASGVSWDTNAGSNFSGGGTLFIPGDLILTQGNLSVISSAGVTRTLFLTGGITANSNFISFAGPACNLSMTGSTSVNFPSPASTQSLGNLTITNGGNTTTFPSTMVLGTRLTVSGNAVFNGASFTTRDVVLNSGTIDFNGPTTIQGPTNLGAGTTLFFEGQSISMGGDFLTLGGVLSSDAVSTLSLSGAIPHTSPLNFAGGSSLASFTINKFNAGTSATISTPITVTTALNLSAGTLSIVGGALSLNSGATVTKSNSASIITSSPSGGPWNLVYTGTAQNTGFEIPASGILTSLTLNTNALNAITLTQNVSIIGALTINGVGRALTCGAFTLAAASVSNAGVINAPSTTFTVSGNFVNNGTYTHNSGTLIIAGACIMSGTQINTTNFNALTINGSGSLTAPTTLNIRSNFSNDGSFTPGVGTVVFNGGVSTLSGTTMSTTSFTNVTVNAGATLVPASNFILTGNLAMNGSFTAGAGTTTFNGTSTLSGTTINTTLFNAVQVNATRSLTASNLTLGMTGNFILDGTFVPGTSGTLSFSGNSTLSGLNIGTTNFINILINGGATVTAPSNLNVQGNFTNNGTFTAGSNTVSFTGSNVSRILSGTTNTQFFALVLNKTNGGTSLSVNSPQTVTSSLALTDGILDNPSSNLSVSSGASVTKSSNASVTTAALGGGPFNLTYITATQPTGFEIPASGILSSLTINVNNGSQVNLGQTITVNNAFSIPSSGRGFTCTANSVTVGSFSSAGTFTAPSAAAATGLTVSGNFANSGLYNGNGGTATFNGTTSLSGASTTTFHSVTISGTLTPLVNFGLTGHFTNNGTFTSGTSTVTFSGVTLQNITGSAPVTTFNNISITNSTNPTSVSMQSNVNLVGIMTLGINAKLDADGSGNTAVLTLLSTNDSPAVDASIAALPATAQVNGNVTVQRFFRAFDNFDRFISSPVSNGTVAQLQASNPATSLPITGDFPGSSFPCTGCVNDGHNFRYYREANPGIINAGYQEWITSTASTLVPGVGYDLYMWNGVTNVTTSLRGTINRGSINLGIVTTPASNSITHTNNGVPAADGWNLVGNPYPSAIQWNNGAGWTRTNIDPTVWVWDVVGRVWHSFNANTSVGDLTNGVIGSSQGFWVYAPAVGAATITINEAAKSIAGSGSYFRTANVGPGMLKVSLTYRGSTDNAFVVINESASDGYEPELDAVKLQLGIEQVSVSIMSRDRKFGHYATNQLKGQHPLHIAGDGEGEYVLSFESLNAFPGIEKYFLVDSYLGQSIPLSSGSYPFTVTSSSETRNDRFYLSDTPMEEKTGVARFASYPNPVSSLLTIETPGQRMEQVTLMNKEGVKVMEIIPVEREGTRAVLDVSSQANGLYIVKVVAGGKLQTKKVIIVH